MKLVKVLIFLLGICCHALYASFAPMLLSEFVDSEFHKSSHTQWLISEKLDGVRGLWDGKQMYFRSGKLMDLPHSFTKHFPPFALDGEIYAEDMDFSEIVSIIKNQSRASEVSRLYYYVFDVPQAKGGLLARLEVLKEYLHTHKDTHIIIIPQDFETNLESVYKRLHAVVHKGGEGLVLRAGDKPYQSGRSKSDFKLKHTQDSECRVVGHTEGRGKYAHMLGALVCEFEGKQFKIGSGLSDDLRHNPPPIGTIISFKYQGLTHNGIPRFPRFWRIKEAE